MLKVAYSEVVLTTRLFRSALVTVNPHIPPATIDGVTDSCSGRTLKLIASELADRIRANATIDWTLKETVRAQMRSMVKQLLRKHKYPPDQQDAATNLVIQQAEVLVATGG